MAFLTNGFRTIIQMTQPTNGLVLREKEVQPTGYDLGGAIETTTMRNNTFITQAPKSLAKTDDMVLQCQYDPAVLAQILAVLGVTQVMSTIFPDGTLWNFWAWLESFKPASLKAGEFPLAEVKILLPNASNVNLGNQGLMGLLYTGAGIPTGISTPIVLPGTGSGFIPLGS
jgi:hypothetical protein